MSITFLDTIQKISQIKKMESSLPIAKKVITITPLTVGDDLALRTSITSPSGYDREIIKLLHEKVEFVDGERTYKEKYQTFVRQISNIDKILMIWALYKVTYESLGNRDINCPKCKEKFKNEIFVEELLQPDSFKLWEEEAPFYEYVYPIEIEYEKFKFEFDTVIPSMSRYNSILGMVSTAEIQKNLDSIGQIFTKAMQMTLLTKTIRIKLIDNPSEVVETSSIQEILISFKRHIPEIVSEDFYDKYNEKFEKYLPRFYKKLTCPNCGYSFDYEVDIETEFFRRAILGRQ